MDHKNQGGRPKASKWMRRSYVIKLRVNSYELERIKAHADALDMGVPEYLRLVGAGKPAPKAG